MVTMASSPLTGTSICGFMNAIPNPALTRTTGLVQQKTPQLDYSTKWAHLSKSWQLCHLMRKVVLGKVCNTVCAESPARPNS